MFYERYVTDYKEEPMVYYCDKDTQVPLGTKYGPVIRDIYIVECCTYGKGMLTVNGKEFPVKAGDAFILMPGDTVIHTTDDHVSRDGYWCAIDGLILGRLFSQIGITSDSPFVPQEAYYAVMSQLEKMYAMRDDTDPGADFRRTACIYVMLGELMRCSSVTADKNMWVQKAIGIMETRYHETLSVASVAEEIGLERSYFSTLFKAQTGLTPHSYLTSLRIKKACTLIRQRDSSISEIASSVGLDPQNFARLFKRETGKTPREYKKEL